MRLLADIHGVGRLGKHVRANIVDKLKYVLHSVLHMAGGKEKGYSHVGGTRR